MSKEFWVVAAVIAAVAIAIYFSAPSGSVKDMVEAKRDKQAERRYDELTEKMRKDLEKKEKWLKEHEGEYKENIVKIKKLMEEISVDEKELERLKKELVELDKK